VLEKDRQAEMRLPRQREKRARAILGVSDATDRRGIRRAFRPASPASHPDGNLADGECCAVLEQLQAPPELPIGAHGGLDGPRGHWCLWREKFFSQDSKERSHADLRVPLQEVRPRHRVSGKAE
jgi:hypothetical protein